MKPQAGLFRTVLLLTLVCVLLGAWLQTNPVAAGITPTPSPTPTATATPTVTPTVTPTLPPSTEEPGPQPTPELAVTPTATPAPMLPEAGVHTATPFPLLTLALGCVLCGALISLALARKQA